jgi:hypothetical protein
VIGGAGITREATRLPEPRSVLTGNALHLEVEKGSVEQGFDGAGRRRPSGDTGMNVDGTEARVAQKQRELRSM